MVSPQRLASWSLHTSLAVLSTTAALLLAHVLGAWPASARTLIVACGAVQLWGLAVFCVRFRGSPHFRTWANLLTLLRYCLAISLALARPGEITGEAAAAGSVWPGARIAVLALLFVAADFADGWLARALGQASPVGGALDEEADSFATLVVGMVMCARGLAAPPLVLHMAFAHYIFLVVHRGLCPDFTWRIGHERALAGAMASAALLSLALQERAPGLARWLGNLSAGLNCCSFGLVYLAMARHLCQRARRSGDNRAKAA
eukprot:g5087.t1